MPFQGPNINKISGGLGRLPLDKDRTIALVAGGVATVDVALNTPVVITSIPQAEQLGINASYDANNNVLVYDHLKECFRLAPNAEVVLILVTAPTNTAQTVALFAENGVVETALNQQLAKDVKYIFTAFNIATANIDNTATGLAKECLDCITPAQQFIDRQFTNKQRYIDGIMLDGVKVFSVNNLQNLRENYGKTNVSVLIAADAYAVDNYEKQASIGAAMGMYAIRRINENIGSVEVLNPPPLFKGKENYPLNDGIRFSDAYLVGTTTKVSTLPFATQKVLNEKGYIFAGYFNGYEGFYLSGDPTTANITSDYAFMNNNSVWNKAARLVRAALIPKVRSVLKKDPATGFLRATTASSLEGIAQTRLEREMLAKDLCSAVKVAIDPQQTPDDQTPLVVKVEVQKDGILHSFDIDISLTNSISL